MKDYIIKVKRDDGSELVVSTHMIEEDVIRHRCGLEDKDVSDNNVVIEPEYIINNDGSIKVTGFSLVRR